MNGGFVLPVPTLAIQWSFSGDTLGGASSHLSPVTTPGDTRCYIARYDTLVIRSVNGTRAISSSRNSSSQISRILKLSASMRVDDKNWSAKNLQVNNKNIFLICSFNNQELILRNKQSYFIYSHFRYRK